MEIKLKRTLTADELQKLSESLASSHYYPMVLEPAEPCKRRRFWPCYLLRLVGLFIGAAAACAVVRLMRGHPLSERDELFTIVGSVMGLFIATASK